MGRVDEKRRGERRYCVRGGRRELVVQDGREAGGHSWKAASGDWPVALHKHRTCIASVG